MKQNFDLHTHSVYSDGKGTPEETVLSAIKMGMDTIGVSDHSFTRFDTSYCMKEKALTEYFEELKRLKKLYADKITVLIGIEQDYYSNAPEGPFDYKIGSVHYLYKNGEYMAVDSAPGVKEGAAYLHRCANRLFEGDIYRLAQCYFETVGSVIEKTGADIIGHFDLISKFNEFGDVLNEKDARYQAAAKNAIDRLLKTGKPFEINTGAISRGYKTIPYPSPDFISYIAEHGGRFVFSSDSHSPQNIGYHFNELEKHCAVPLMSLTDLL